MISRKTFTLILIFIAFIASIYAPFKILSLPVTLNISTSPYNTLWNGTSEFYNTLIDRGYKVYMVTSLNDIDRIITNNDSIVYIVIAPDKPFTPIEVEKLIEIASRAKRVSFLIADESVTSNTLLNRLFNLSIPGIVLRDPLSPYGPLYPVVKCSINGTTYTLLLNIASYIDIHNVSGGFEILCRFNSKPVIIYCTRDWYDGVILSDSSIFINQFFNEKYLNESIPSRYTPIDNKRFALDIVELLTRGDRDCKILIDCYHYRVLDINSLMNLPIPPIGLILSLLATMVIRFLDTLYLSLLGELPLTIKIPILLAILLLSYSLLRRVGGICGYDEGIYRHSRVSVLCEVELPEKRIYNVKHLSKRDTIELLASLYTILCKVASKELSIDFTRVDDGKVRDRIRLIFGKDSVRVLKTLYTLRKIYEYHTGKRRIIWPPIVFWRRTLSKLILNSEMILKVMGTTILGKSGVKGVEYKLRKI